MTRTWKQILDADPEHSHRYAERWEQLEADGVDVDGEARLVDALVPRGARILDAGCGTGRLGGYLAARGHRVVGVDLDPYLVDCARLRYPGASWEIADLASEGWAAGPFDLVVSAGNVLAFIEPADRVAVLSNLASRMVRADQSIKQRAGQLLVGFGLDRGWLLEDFLRDAETAGLTIVHRWSSWDLQPSTEESGFLVALLVASV